MWLRHVSVTLLIALFASATAQADTPPPRAWPPPDGPGVLFVHYGEEHWNDADGLRILPRVIEDSARYRPALVAMSGDKDSDGTVENLTRWKQLMAAYDRAGIPYFAAVGNHDRKKKPGFPDGVDPTGDLAPYKEVFADRPYPFGDAPPYTAAPFAPRARPMEDPPGASSHYAVDFGNVRWLFLDNSCFSIVNCDPLQNPPFPDEKGNQGQLDFLRAEAADASAKGMLVFVVMHMPTQDDRPGHTQPTPSAHTMGEGGSPDNQTFEQTATAAGVGGVFAGHIKGQWLYQAGGVSYFTDGGAGGELYVNPGGEVGVDTGYWHGYRLVRVNGNRVTTDAVPIFVPGSLSVTGPASVRPGETASYLAKGRQPTQEGPKVDALELRDPDPKRPNAKKLPAPVRIWTTGNRFVLAPVAGARDDPRRDPATQTSNGRFAARCPGRTRVTVTSGWESASLAVVVRRAPGRVARAIRARRHRVARRHATTVAAVVLRQPGEVVVRVVRRGRTIRTLAHDCFPPGTLRATWDGTHSNTGLVRRGRYTVEVRVRSDGRTTIRRWSIRAV